MNERLYRSRDDRIIAGVAGGLAQQFRIDPSLVRILWVILVIPTGGLALLLYIIMAFVVPEEPAGDARWAAWDRGPGGYGWPEDAGSSSTGGGVPAGVAGGMGSATAAPGPGGQPGSFAMSEPSPTTSADAAAISPTPGTDTGSSTTAAGPLGVPAGFTPRGAGFTGGGATPGPGPGPTRDARDAWREQRHAWRDERRAARREHRDGFGALLFGLILILVGAYFLVRAYVPAFDTDRAWPFLILGIGVVLLFGAIRRSNGPNGG